jgi:predicted HTH domain antitoxin
MVQKLPKEREKLAVELYREGNISLGKTCEIAGLSYEVMKELLINNNVEIRRGSPSLEELKTKANELTEIL